MQAVPPSPVDPHDPDAFALEFLASEFAGNVYIDWPIERRLEAYLRRRGIPLDGPNGRQFDTLLHCVMANFRAARKAGWLAKPASGGHVSKA